MLLSTAGNRRIGGVMARNVLCTALVCTMAICALAGPARKHGLGGIRYYPYPHLPAICLILA